MQRGTMSSGSPSKRREMDVMKMCVRQTFNLKGPRYCLDRPLSAFLLLGLHESRVCRMMSDWKVELVNDNINELYVEFKGPKESELRYPAPLAFDIYK